MAMRFGLWLMEHPEEAARIQGVMALEEQAKTAGVPLTEEDEDEL